MLIWTIRIASALLAIYQASLCFATDLNSMLCNARRLVGLEHIAQRNPDFEKNCFAFGLKIVREATGHDGNLIEAEGIFETLLQVNPESAYPLIGSTELKLRKHALGRLPDSLYRVRDEAERATRIKPTVPESFVTLGRVDILIGCLPCADKSAKRAEELGVSDPELRMLQATIAELQGDEEGAKSRLTEALTVPSLPPESKTAIHLALAALYARSKHLTDADREFGNAIVAAPENVISYVKRAEFILYVHGDAAAASEAAANANKIAMTPEGKRVASLAEYLVWAREYLGGHTAKDIKRISQVSFVAPEEAFVLAARYVGLSKIVEAMLDAAVVQGTEARDGDGKTALIAAGAGSNIDVARMLIARRANVNAQTRSGERALSFFIFNGNHDAAMLLLKAGAEVNYFDNDGSSPLSLAVQRRDTALVIELLRRKAEVSARDQWLGGDLLSTAAMTDDAETVKALLNNGVKVDAKNRYGQPALAVAASWGSKTVMRLMLERGAPAQSAIDAARETGNREIIDMLEAARKRSI